MLSITETRPQFGRLLSCLKLQSVEYAGKTNKHLVYKHTTLDCKTKCTQWCELATMLL